MVTNVGTVTDPVCISDNVTPANGTFAVYLNPEKRPWRYNNKLIYQQAIGNDNSLGNSWGASTQIYTFRNCRWPISGSGGNMEKLKRAIAYWSANDSRPYLQVLDVNDYNQATWGNLTGSAVTQWRVQILDVDEIDENSQTHTFNLSVLRVTVPS